MWYARKRVSVSDVCRTEARRSMPAYFPVPILLCCPAPFFRYSTGERLSGLPGGGPASFHKARAPNQRKFPIQFVQHRVLADCMRQRSVRVPRPQWQHGGKTSCLDSRHTLRQGIALELGFKVPPEVPCDLLKRVPQNAIAEQAGMRAIQKQLASG